MPNQAMICLISTRRVWESGVSQSSPVAIRYRHLPCFQGRITGSQCRCRRRQAAGGWGRCRWHPAQPGISPLVCLGVDTVGPCETFSHTKYYRHWQMWEMIRIALSFKCIEGFWSLIHVTQSKQPCLFRIGSGAAPKFLESQMTRHKYDQNQDTRT